MAKSLTSRLEDAPRRFCAYAPVAGQDVPRRIYAPVDSIATLFEYGDGISCIEMKSGVVIPVALDVDALNAKIYDATDAVVDLYAVTGAAVQEISATVFRTSFNHAASEKSDKGLSIVAYIHPSYDADKFQRVTFAFDDVYTMESTGGSKTPMTYIQLSAGKWVDGRNAFYMDLPIETFTAQIDQAKKSGNDTLNLCDITRPRKPGSGFVMPL